MAVGVVALFAIVFCELSRVRVSPLRPDLNLRKVESPGTAAGAVQE